MKKDDIIHDDHLPFKDKEVLVYGMSSHWHELRSHCEKLSPGENTEATPAKKIPEQPAQLRMCRELTKPGPDASKDERRAWQNRHIAKMQDDMNACGFGRKR